MKTTIDSTGRKHLFFFTLRIITYFIILIYPAKAELISQISQNENIRKIDCVDEYGTIVFNWSRGYASILQRLDKDKNVIEEYYFDELNNPVAQSAGHYGRKHEYNSRGQIILTTYIDRNGNSMRISYGYSSVRREYNDLGQNVKEFYYDNNEQVILKNGEAGIYKEYDNLGRNKLITYLDLYGMPVTIKAGYCSLSRSFNDTGLIEYEYYLDLHKVPVQAVNGAYGLHREYNEKGQCISITYLDSYGLPTLNTSGYSIIRYYYDASGKKNEERFFDTMERPISIGRGQYGIKHIYKKNLLIRSIPIGNNGQELFFFDSFLSEHPLIVVIGAIILLIITLYSDRKSRLFLLFLYILFILYMTIFVRIDNTSKHSFVFFGSYRQIFSSSSARKGIYENILLFVPAGALLKSLWPSSKGIYWFAWLPVTIELLQFFFHLGEFQFDDIVSNGIGLFIGILFISLLRRYKARNAYVTIDMAHIHFLS